MRIAIISDVHGNLPALERVLRHIENNGINDIISLGDNIGYGPWANETMDLIWEKTNIRVPGNHEELIGSVISEKIPDNIYNIKDSDALANARFIADSLNQTNRERLIELLQSEYVVKANFGGQSCSFSHANPSKPKDMNYIFTQHDAIPLCFDDKNVKSKFNFSGHTHNPLIAFYYETIEGEKVIGSKDYYINNVFKVMIIVPSVGQPRDFNKQTGYVVFDTDEKKVEFKRTTYDIDSVIKKMDSIKEYDNSRLKERLRLGN